MQQIKRAIKESAMLHKLRDLSGPVLKELPIYRWPGWLGLLQGIKVPRGVKHFQPRGTASPASINVLLTLLKRVEGVPGAIAECGVYQGSTLLPMGLYLNQTRSGKKVFAFDSFQGFDATVDVDVALGGAEDPFKKVGGFNGTSYERLCRRIYTLGLRERIRVFPGFFRDTLPQCKQKQFSLVHLDCDIYESYRTTLEFFYPRMASGGVILLDEYNDPPWPGCNKAVDEFLLDKTETLNAIEQDGYVKYYFAKKG
jgi:hypothetical protein